MNVLEAQWLGQKLATVQDQDLFPMLNVGSSTLEFRTHTQPHIDKHVFAPLRARGGKIFHLDIKRSPGVDICGDLLDPDFLNSLLDLKVKSIMLSNLLEHVEERDAICRVVEQIVPQGGYLFVSGPADYPYHADPIDTMFRPTINELHGYFPKTTIVESAVIDSGNWRQWNRKERGRSLARTVVRLMTPFYRPAKWLEVARQSPYIFRHITAFAVVLRKVA